MAVQSWCQERWSDWEIRNLIFGLVSGRFAHGFRLVGLGHQETARFSGGPASALITQPHPASHVFCVGTLDRAPVSNSVRSVSNSARQTTPSVSANVR